MISDDLQAPKPVPGPKDDRSASSTFQSASTGGSSSFLRHFRRYLREWSVVIALAVLLLVLAVRAPQFFNLRQIIPTLCAAVPILLAACGVSFVIICRQIDISIGSMFALCSILLGLMIQAGWPLPLAILAAVSAGGALGAFNGLL